MVSDALQSIRRNGQRASGSIRNLGAILPALLGVWRWPVRDHAASQLDNIPISSTIFWVLHNGLEVCRLMISKQKIVVISRALQKLNLSNNHTEFRHGFVNQRRNSDRVVFVLNHENDWGPHWPKTGLRGSLIPRTEPFERGEDVGMFRHIRKGLPTQPELLQRSRGLHRFDVESRHVIRLQTLLKTRESVLGWRTFMFGANITILHHHLDMSLTDTIAVRIL
jgi:hypothetical protein